MQTEDVCDESQCQQGPQNPSFFLLTRVRYFLGAALIFFAGLVDTNGMKPLLE